MSSLIRRVHHVTGVNPFELCRIGDAGDTPVNPVNLLKALDLITNFFEPLAAAGVTTLSCGGDHLITLPIFRAIAKNEPVGMVHFDAIRTQRTKLITAKNFTTAHPFAARLKKAY